MAELRVSPEAANDLQKIRQYISAQLDAPVAAQKLVSRILKSMRGLADFPESGPNLSSVLNIETDYRFQVCGNYLIFYRVEKQIVYIVRILYGKRNYLKLLFGEQRRRHPITEFTKLQATSYGETCTAFFGPIPSSDFGASPIGKFVTLLN
jgi:toxin ParE1/3/4